MMKGYMDLNNWEVNMKDKSISVLLPSHEVLKGGAICQGFVTLYSSVLFIPQVAPIGDSFQV